MSVSESGASEQKKKIAMQLCGNYSRRLYFMHFYVQWEAFAKFAHEKWKKKRRKKKRKLFTSFEWNANNENGKRERMKKKNI